MNEDVTDFPAGGITLTSRGYNGSQFAACSKIMNCI